MKSQERFELVVKGLSEGKTKSAIAREMGVTPALISQTLKKHTPVQEVVEQQAVGA
jgi:hypothetical protein